MARDKLKDYIKYYDNVLPDDMCRKLCEKLDESPEPRRVHRKNETFNFIEVNMHEMMKNDTKWKSITMEMHKYMQKALSLYRADTGQWLPETKRFEAPRIKRYDPNYGIFDWHLDSADVRSAQRMVVMFWYLNDVPEGGETSFDIGTGKPYKIKPIKGRVACFPPNFLFPHKGEPPKDSFKYVVSSYACYP
jgi:prolyl 4-hydroxylase